MPFVDRLSLFRRSAPVGYRSRYDSCLDQIEETISYSDSGTGSGKQSSKSAKRRSTMLSSPSYSPKSLLDITAPNLSGGKKFLSFFHKGFHGTKSKSMSRMDQQDFVKIATDRKNLDALNGIVPIPIRETAIQSHSRTLFHKVPQSNVRAKPLLKLNAETKFIPIHSSLLSKQSNYCVKIISIFPTDYRKCSSGNKYELLLPTGTPSLGHTCHVDCCDKLEVQCPSCHASHLSLYGIDKQLTHMTGYVFSCSSESERKKWLNVLTRVARPNLQNERRRENSLNIWIQEAKNVLLKKRYFCEIYLDETLHARTTTKTMTNMLFWGEEFHLCNLEEIKTVTILLWKATNDNKMKKKKSNQRLICQITISTKDIEQRNSIEKWYSASYSFSSGTIATSSSFAGQNTVSFIKTSENPFLESIQIPSLSHSSVPSVTNDHIPMIRIKARYQNLDVLPISDYSRFTEFLRKNAVHILLQMESYLKVKNKEDLVGNLINVIHQQGIAVEFLCDLIFHEISISDDQNMILRGNTMASKAIEVYLKLIGEKYLNLTLSDFVNRVLQGDDDCEVDPQKDNHDFYNSLPSTGSHSSSTNEKSNLQYSLQQRQESLLMNVDMVWAKIMSSAIYFPKNLKLVFIALRKRLDNSNRAPSITKSKNEPNLCDRIISACIFLRYICPAILTPSLFGLIPEYPDNPKVTRTFTLVAKCIQTLANFSDLTGCKESYMVFMNSFIENKFATMRSFLEEISTESEKDISKTSVDSVFHEPDNQNCLYWENLGNSLSEDSIDLSLCLAKLHRQLEDYLKLIPAQKFSSTMEVLYGIVEEISLKLKTKQAASAQSIMKYSQSYQDMKGNHKAQLENENEYYDSSYYSSSTLTRVADKGSNTVVFNHPMKSKKASSGNPRQNQIISSNSFYLEGNAINQQPFDKTSSTASYLMTQSLIEDNLNCSYTQQSNAISKEQVDKEWKEMVSQSNNYIGPIELRLNVDNKGQESAPYHTSSKKTCSRKECSEKPPSPPPSITNSVKKCKQSHRYFEPIILPDDIGNDILSKRQQPSRFVSTALRRNSTDQASIKYLANSIAIQKEIVDSCSTETITSPSHQNPKKHNQAKCSVNSSISMPSFNISDPPNDYHQQAFRICIAGRSCARKDNNEPQNSIKQPYNQISDDGNATPVNSIPTMHYNEMKVKQMKHSLDQLHHTLNARMTQLLLADNTTIQLEMERVCLMKQIIGTASNQTFQAFQHLQLMGPNSKWIPSNGNITDSPRLLHDSVGLTNLSVQRYLEIAETVLSEAQQNHVKGDSDKQTEGLLMQIFQTNQSLQNSLINKLDCCISKSELLMSHPKAVGNAGSHAKCQISDLPNYKPSLGTDSALINKNSTDVSILNSSSSAIIELVDAV